MYCGLLQVELLNQSSFPFKFSSRNFICNSIGMTKLFKYALIILVAFQQPNIFSEPPTNKWQHQKSEVGYPGSPWSIFQVSSGSAVTSKLKLSALRRWAKLWTSKMLMKYGKRSMLVFSEWTTIRMWLASQTTMTSLRRSRPQSPSLWTVSVAMINPFLWSVIKKQHHCNALNYCFIHVVLLVSSFRYKTLTVELGISGATTV